MVHIQERHAGREGIWRGSFSDIVLATVGPWDVTHICWTNMSFKRFFTGFFELRTQLLVLLPPIQRSHLSI